MAPMGPPPVEKVGKEAQTVIDWQAMAMAENVMHSARVQQKLFRALQHEVDNLQRRSAALVVDDLPTDQELGQPMGTLDLNLVFPELDVKCWVGCPGFHPGGALRLYVRGIPGNALLEASDCVLQGNIDKDAYNNLHGKMATIMRHQTPKAIPMVSHFVPLAAMVRALKSLKGLERVTPGMAMAVIAPERERGEPLYGAVKIDPLRIQYLPVTGLKAFMQPVIVLTKAMGHHSVSSDGLPLPDAGGGDGNKWGGGGKKAKQQR
jgi:hypothetical protein